MAADPKDYIPVYVSEIIKETDGTINDCTLCAAITLADAWTLGEWLTRSDGTKRNVISLRERRAKILGPAKADGGLTLADANAYLHDFDQDLPDLPRYPGHGGSLRVSFDQFWDFISNGYAGILLGNPAKVKDTGSPLRTVQNSDNYPHAIFTYRAGPKQAIVFNALTRHGPSWDGEPVPKEDLRQFSGAFGVPNAIGCSLVPIGGATQAMRERHAKEVAVKLLKVSNKQLVLQRDETQHALDLAHADLETANQRIAVLESATQPDLTVVKRDARQSMKDEVLSAVGAVAA